MEQATIEIVSRPVPEGGYVAECQGLKTWHLREDDARLRVAREAWKARGARGFVGASLEELLERVCARLRGLAVAPDSAGLAHVRELAAFAGCAVKCKKADIRNDPSTVAARWLEDAERRLGVVRAYVQRTRDAGPIGREGVLYRVVMADPPWLYGDQGTRAAPAYAGPQRASSHYGALPDEEICALGEGVRAAAASSSILLLWATNAVVSEGRHVAVCRAWGFEPKVTIPWLKTTRNGGAAMGMGHYTRGVHEDLIAAARGEVEISFEGDRIVLASRGRAAGEVVASRAVKGLLVAPRHEHSRKPEEQYAFAEALCRGPYLEMFARGPREGWDCWGNEACGK